MQELDTLRATQKQERAQDQAPLWAAILALHDALLEAGAQGLPDGHIHRARDVMLRAGLLSAGDLSDDELMATITTDGAREWREDMGQVYEGEGILHDGQLYVCMVSHLAQALYAPGTEGGRNLYRILRAEPEEGYLDFVWGEHVPYGAVRRDPVDGQLYTPIHEAGITLYEPHYPHMVPSQYDRYVEEGGGEEGGPPSWESLPDGHMFGVGDMFTDDGAIYEVLRAFGKQIDRRPPALLDDYYKMFV